METYNGEKPLYSTDWTIEQAEANAPEGSEVVVGPGGLDGAEGIVIEYNMRKGAGSWGAEASVKMTAPAIFLGYPVAFVPVQKMPARRLVRKEQPA